MSLDDELRALERMDLEALRQAWRRLVGPPPKLRSVELLRYLLAWRLQAKVYGGLDASTRRQLRAASRGPESSLPCGARLVREWKGLRHEVEVSESGFLLEGRCYRSLSEAARAITGSRWNGPRFFGLRVAA